jgi:hypothetical protein
MIRIFLVLASSSLLAGCNLSSPSTQPQGQSAEILSIRQELDSVKAELTEIKKKQSEHDFENLVRDFDRVAYLQPGDSGYATVRYDLGVLTVELADITTYANGSKVRLRFGNPLSSTVTGLKAKIEWGRTDENGSPDNSSAKSKTATFTEPLRSGAWTTVDVVLDGVPPTDLGFVRVKDVAHTGIRLAR